MEIRCCNTCNRKTYCSILKNSKDIITQSEFFCCAHDSEIVTKHTHTEIKSRWWKLDNGEYAKVAAFVLSESNYGAIYYIIRGQRFNPIDFNDRLFLED